MISPPPSQAQTTDDMPLDDDSASGQIILSWRARATAFFAQRLSGVRGLVVAGTGMTLIYLMLMLAFPLKDWWYRTEDNLGTIPAKSSWAQPLIHLFGVNQLNIWLSVSAALIIIALFSLQGLAVFAAQTTRDVRQAHRVIIGFAIVFIVTMIWMQPITSTDLYGYLARSYLIADLHQNPTISLSTLLPGGYLVPHARPPAPYGPLWLMICGGVGWVVGEDLFLAMVLMKLIMAVAAIVTIFLVAWLADKILPGQRVQSLVLFAWSPLLIFEAIGNGHNDILMMFFVVASIAAIVAHKPIFAFPLLAMGVLVKYSVGALVPLWAVLLLLMCCLRYAETENKPFELREWRTWLSEINWKRFLRIFGIGGAISVAIAAICYAPFWVGAKTFTGLGQQLGATYFNGSIAELVYSALKWGAPGPNAASLGSAIRLTLYATFAIYVLAQTRHLFERGRDVAVANLTQVGGKVIFAALVLVTFWYQPWYIVWLLPLAALAPDAILRRHAATLAFGGMLTYIIQYFAFMNQTSLAQGFFTQFFLVIVAFAPLLVFQHASEQSGWRATLNRIFSGLNNFVSARPALVNRVMLGLILIVAALLRLLRLGSLDSSGSSLIRHLSGNLSLLLVDSRGLQGPFALLQGLSIRIFGATPFAVYLPTALFGTLTVWLIYALATNLFSNLPLERRQMLGLVAALFAATAQWHVALSRSGVQIVVLPLLICVIVLELWHWRYPHPTVAEASSDSEGERMTPRQYAARLRQLALAGICVGLISDLEPRLWLMPLLLVLLALVVWWRRRAWCLTGSGEPLVLIGATLLTVIPTIWYYLSPSIGFAPGSTFFAQGSARKSLDPSIFDGAFWVHLASNVTSVARVLVTQDYGAVGPNAGGIPILPTLFLPFVIFGLVQLMRHWQRPQSVVLMVLIALPFVVTLLSPAPPSVIEAATVLPVMCIIPALGLEEIGHWIATLPALLVGENGIFISRQNLMRTALLLMLLIATVSTFFWYFASTLVGPTHIIQPQ